MLPTELQQEIAGYLPIKDRLSLATTSRFHYNLLRQTGCVMNIIFILQDNLIKMIREKPSYVKFNVGTISISSGQFVDEIVPRLSNYPDLWMDDINLIEGYPPECMCFFKSNIIPILPPLSLRGSRRLSIHLEDGGPIERIKKLYESGYLIFLSYKGNFFEHLFEVIPYVEKLNITLDLVNVTLEMVKSTKFASKVSVFAPTIEIVKDNHEDIPEICELLSDEEFFFFKKEETPSVVNMRGIRRAIMTRPNDSVTLINTECLEYLDVSASVVKVGRTPRLQKLCLQTCRVLEIEKIPPNTLYFGSSLNHHFLFTNDQVIDFSEIPKTILPFGMFTCRI